MNPVPLLWARCPQAVRADVHTTTQPAEVVYLVQHIAQTPHPTKRPHSCCYLAVRLTSINFTSKMSGDLSALIWRSLYHPEPLSSSHRGSRRSQSLRRSPYTIQSAAVDIKPSINMAPSAYSLSVWETCRTATASLRKDARTLCSQSEPVFCAQHKGNSQWEASELPSLCPTVVVYCLPETIMHTRNWTHSVEMWKICNEADNAFDNS